MKQLLLLTLFVASCWSTSSSALDDAITNNIAKNNHLHNSYIINCQGCHGVNGEAVRDVPALNGFVANFLKVEGGREFLVRVPGVAMSPLNDKDTADILNWMLYQFSSEQIPDDFVRYSASEVAKLRKDILVNKLPETRKRLVDKIDKLMNRPIEET